MRKAYRPKYLSRILQATCHALVLHSGLSQNLKGILK